MPGRADVELGTEPREEKEETMGSHRSDAESGTTETSDRGFGPGARRQQGGLQRWGLGHSSCHAAGCAGPDGWLGMGRVGYRVLVS